MGALPFTVQCWSRAGSSVIRALPLSLSVSSKPGMKNRQPTFGLATMFDMVSSRLLPGRSGIRMVPSSTTWTKPADRPRGEIRLAVGIRRRDHQEGRHGDELAGILVERRRDLVMARGCTSPNFARRSPSLPIMPPSRFPCAPRPPSRRGPSRRDRTSRGSRRW